MNCRGTTCAAGANRTRGAYTCQMLVLARHGATPLNERGLVQGSQDAELTDAGREQAHVLGAWVGSVFHPEAVYSSPARRSRDTAIAIAAACGCVEGVIDSDLLRERDYGPFEGLDDQQLRAGRAAAGAPADDHRQNWSGVESVESDAAVWHRFQMFAEAHDVLPRAADNDIVIVSHGGFVKAVTCSALWIPSDRPYPLAILPASAVAFAVVDGYLQLMIMWQNTTVMREH